MSDWRQETLKHEFKMPGVPGENRIWVTGAFDLEEGEPSKILIYESDDNQGHALRSPGIMEAAIQSVSDRLGFDAEEVEWYAMGRDNQMYSLDVREEVRPMPHPQWQELANSGDLNLDDLWASKKQFPDQDANVVSARWNSVGYEESLDIVEAFAMEEASPEHAVPQQTQHVFDLAQEYFSRLEPEPEIPLQFEEPDLRPETSQSFDL